MWSGVIAELQAAGIGVIAPANPLRGLDCDAGYIASIAGAIDGPVMLAGHSYGGRGHHRGRIFAETRRADGFWTLEPSDLSADYSCVGWASGFFRD